jgi:hypothetical protein
VPADEPAEQAVSPARAARVTLLRAPVVVIDGRPRYHVVNCLHLLGRRGEIMQVRLAVELGFTPCALCEPATAVR